MSQQQEQQAQTEKKTVAGVSFTGTASGKLDESEIPSDSYKSHYMYPADTKSESSYPVVDASGDLRKGNVISAWKLGCRGRCDNAEKHDRRLKKLSSQFESDPLADKTRESERFERSVEFKATDSDEQIATGAVLVPDELDHQFDYFRGDTIRDLAENYEERFESGDVYGGVMHSVFPDGAIDLVENRVLEEAETIGGEEYPPDTWVQSYKFTDDELWGLVEDGILGGNSIGGTAKGVVTVPIPEDVRVPEAVADGVPDDRDVSYLPGRKITEGRVLEVSAVDMPAVPRATHAEHKASGMHKGHPALTDSIVQARLYLEHRGHDPEDAKRLAEYLQSEKSREPSGWLERAKRFFTSGDGGGDDFDAVAMQQKTDHFEKGATLSEENVRRGMAIHDIALDLLETEIDTGRQSFATDDSFEFGGVAYVPAADTGDSGDGAGSLFSASKARASNGDEPAESGRGADADLTELMNSDEFEDVLKDIQTTQDELNERMDTLESDDDDPEADEKSDPDADSETEPDRVDELAGQVEELAEATKQTNELVTRMADARGVSQQADVSATENEKNGEGGDDPLDDFAKLLS